MGNIRLTQFAIAIALGGLYFISLAPAQGKSQDGKIARLMTIGIGQEKVRARKGTGKKRYGQEKVWARKGMGKKRYGQEKVWQEKVCGLVLHFESGTLFFSGPFSFLKHMRS